MKIKKIINMFVIEAKATVKLISDDAGNETISYYATDEKIEKLKKDLATCKKRIDEEINKEEERFNAFYNL
ncbi:hypothetical protein [Planococcus versutus]|uniref:Uncharacterized protein n=1 Tax=Planococcus versutus TaxID=1302659 RepID=A0A1B1RZB1_9BACL|nr:hypothetical protein [Planococcus versutus]ANU26281.1 hypothetical protein I858_004445 [Planococcus versutus]